MAHDSTTIHQMLLQQLEQLHQAREDLLFECQIDRADVHTQWNQLDDALRSAREELNRISGGDQAIANADEIAAASEALLNAVRIQIARIRRNHELQSQEGQASDRVLFTD